jgi:hypothetical protein
MYDASQMTCICACQSVDWLLLLAAKAVLVVLRIRKGGNHQVLNMWKETVVEEVVKTRRV